METFLLAAIAFIPPLAAALAQARTPWLYATGAVSIFGMGLAVIPLTGWTDPTAGSAIVYVLHLQGLASVAGVFSVLAVIHFFTGPRHDLPADRIAF